MPLRRAVGFGIGTRQVQRAVDDELAFHLEMRARQLAERGMSADDARREALRQFGDLDGVRASCLTLDRERIRTMERANLVGDLRQDLRHAVRMLRRNPAVTLVVALTLALGIGANTAIFTLVDAVLLRNLPVLRPKELVVLGNPTRVGSMGFDSSPRADQHSWTTYLSLRDDRQFTTGLLASGRVDRLDVQLETGATEPEHPRGRFVSGNYFRVLGVPALRGRTLGPEADRPGGVGEVTISHRYWTRRFNQDPRVIGRDILVNGSRLTITGVTPDGFTGEIVGVSTDVWIPIALQAALNPNRAILDQTQAYWLLLMGRLAPGVTLPQARAGYTELVRRQLATQAGPGPQVDDARAVAVPVEAGARGLSRVRASYEAPLLTLMVGVGILLLIICANVGNLLLARAVARSREMSVRLAIGAGRGRLLRQLLTESAVLGLLGAGLGLLVARWGSSGLLALVADGGSVIPLDVRLDLPVLAFTALLAVMAVAGFGLAPALRASRMDLAGAIRAGTRSLTGGGVGGRGRHAARLPLGRVLVGAQVALSLVLLIGAALLVRSMLALQGADTGLDRDRLLIADVDANARGYDGTRLGAFALDLAGRLQRVPGVFDVTFSENGIFSGTESVSNLGVPGFAARAGTDSLAAYDQVGPGYVKATGARLLKGRDFFPSDNAAAPVVVMLNEAFARFYFGGGDPLGRTIRVGDSTSATVIGVVADIWSRELTRPPDRRFYLSYLQSPLGAPGALRLIVHASANPAGQALAVRAAIRAADQAVPIDAVEALSTLMRTSIREQRLLANLAMAFGTMALLLAAIGLYGVMTYQVTRRTGEIGLRVALGASRPAVVGMVVRDAMSVVAAGIAVGVPLALGATRLIRNQLHGVGPTDAVAIGLSLVVLLVSGVSAALLPALRASRVAPAVALREE